MSIANRAFSLEEDFMRWDTNDILYSFMRCLSTTSPDLKEYLPIKEFNKHKQIIAGICGCSTRTIARQLDKLFERGLLDQGVQDIKGKETEVFWFPRDYNGAYKLINKDILKYLINTRSTQSIRIYIYLLNKYQWKPDYCFTINEIKQALGFAATTKSCDKIICNILASLNKEGIIQYSKHIAMTEVGNKQIPVERMKLTYVIEQPEALPKF